VFWVATAGLLGSVGFFGCQALGQSEFFQIAAIEIEGCQRTTKQEIRELSGLDVHSNLLAISSRRVKDVLAGHDWIERVELSREWPDRLNITVKERSPVALVSLSDGLHYIDQTATVFAPADKTADLDYPVITGLAGVNGLAEADSAVLQEALQLIKFASRGDNPNLPVQNISEISIRENSLVLYLMDRPFPIRLGTGDIWGKYNRLVKVLYWLYKKKEFDSVSYVYVDYSEDKVLVGMGRGG
jgi:cell division protein FtsQ